MIRKDITGIMIPRHDTEENWDALTNFVPEKGEIIVYDRGDWGIERIKIGDGVNIPKNLYFLNEDKNADFSGHLSEIDKQLGDIESALDAILAIQNSILGEGE